MKHSKLLILTLIGIILIGGCTPTSKTEDVPNDVNSKNDVTENTDPELMTEFEGKITSIDEDNKMLSIDMTVPYKDTIILNYTDESEFADEPSNMLRIGASVRFETNGVMTSSIPAQMTALNFTDAWVEYDSPEKIQNMFENREEMILNNEIVELELKKGDEFLIKLDRNDALDSNWYWEVSREGSFEYQEQAQFMDTGVNTVSNLYQMKALEKGEHYLYFHEYDLKTGETLRNISFQLIVRDETNTEGAIIEIVGEVVTLENNTVYIKTDDKELSIYAANLKSEYPELQTGDQLILGAQVGEASYQLAFAAQKNSTHEKSSLPVVQHIVKIESVTDNELRAIWGQALLSIYHNDLITNLEDDSAVYYYIEYTVDKANEANELLYIEPIK